MDGSSLKSLVQSSQRGDRSAYAELVRIHSSRVFAICLGSLSDRHDAEDVAQQTLLKGFTDIGQLRRGESFGPWIGRIARNLCIDFLRRRGRQLNKRAGRPVVTTSNSNEHPELQAALGKLSAEYRVALMLFYFDGQSAGSVAQTLGISEAAVHTRLCRARKQLRTILQTDGGME